jgi:6-phosphogluconolactonase
MSTATAAEYSVYFGTYTGGKSQGIYVSSFDDATGKLGEPKLAAELKNPSFVALHPNGKTLYSVAEVDEFKAQKKSGGLASFKRNADQTLEQIDSDVTRGAAPCHVSVDSTGKLVLAANYTGGSLTAFAIGDNGGLEKEAAFFQHAGSSVNPGRQKEPHVHNARITPNNKFACVCDLGQDKVFIYKLDPAAGTVTLHGEAKLAPGSGPRHIAFAPDAKSAYVINEMTCTLTTFTLDQDAGTLTERQTVSTLPKEDPFKGSYSTAEVVAHPNGKFVYGSNRGHDTIAVYSVGGDGNLTLVQNQPSGGKTPRNFAIDPSGKWLLSANQDSDKVVVMSIDQSTGKLTATDSTIIVGKPVCVIFAK